MATPSTQEVVTQQSCGLSCRQDLGHCLQRQRVDPTKTRSSRAIAMLTWYSRQAGQQSIPLQCQGAGQAAGCSTCQRMHAWGPSPAASGASSVAPSFSASFQEGTSRPACASISTSAHTGYQVGSVHQHWSSLHSRRGTHSRAPHQRLCSLSPAASKAWLRKQQQLSTPAVSQCNKNCFREDC